MSVLYRLLNIRILLREGFTEEEIRSLNDEISAIHNTVFEEVILPPDLADLIIFQDETISQLIVTALSGGQVEVLLGLLKSRKPDLYKENEPYHFNEADLSEESRANIVTYEQELTRLKEAIANAQITVEEYKRKIYETHYFFKDKATRFEGHLIPQSGIWIVFKRSAPAPSNIKVVDVKLEEQRETFFDVIQKPIGLVTAVASLLAIITSILGGTTQSAGLFIFAAAATIVVNIILFYFVFAKDPPKTLYVGRSAEVKLVHNSKYSNRARVFSAIGGMGCLAGTVILIAFAFNNSRVPTTQTITPTSVNITVPTDTPMPAATITLTTTITTTLISTSTNTPTP